MPTGKGPRSLFDDKDQEQFAHDIQGYLIEEHLLLLFHVLLSRDGHQFGVRKTHYEISQPGCVTIHFGVGLLV